MVSELVGGARGVVRVLGVVLFGMKKRTVSKQEIDELVENRSHLPLREIEDELDITRVNDVRSRAGYSKSTYYRNVSDEERKRRRQRIDRLLKKHGRAT